MVRMVVDAFDKPYAQVYATYISGHSLAHAAFNPETNFRFPHQKQNAVPETWYIQVPSALV